MTENIEPQNSPNTQLERVLKGITALKLTLNETFPGTNSVEVIVRGKIFGTGAILGIADELGLPQDDQGAILLEIFEECDFEKYLVLIKSLYQKSKEFTKHTPLDLNKPTFFSFKYLKNKFTKKK